MGIYIHLSNVRIYTIHCKTTERPGMRTIGETNASRFIPPLQYHIDVKNVVMSKAYKIKPFFS
jgi:hypothetical protein